MLRTSIAFHFRIHNFSDRGGLFSVPGSHANYILRFYLTRSSETKLSRAIFNSHTAVSVMGTGITEGPCSAGADISEARRRRGKPLRDYAGQRLFSILLVGFSKQPWRRWSKSSRYSVLAEKRRRRKYRHERSAHTKGRAFRPARIRSSLGAE
jgi:hypothetical protein